MTLSLSRRHLMQVAAGLLTALSMGAPATAEASDAFAALRAKWGVMLTGAGLYDPALAENSAYIAGIDTDAAQWQRSMTQAPSAGGAIWNDAFAGKDVVNTRTSLDRLRLLAIAYATPGSQYHGDARLLDDIRSALRFIAAERYTLTIAKAGNWWEWQIGIPLALLDCVLVLDGQLDRDLVGHLMTVIDRFTPAPTMTAANLVWTAHIVLLRSLVSENAAGVQAAINAVETTFADVTTGDGFHADGSFVQHDEFAYTGGYGLSLLQRTTDLIYLLDGTPFSPSLEAWQPVRHRIYTAFEPLMERGGLMDMVLGRGISRSYGQSHMIGRQVTAAVTRLAFVSPEPDASAFKGMVKTWVRDDTLSSLLIYDPQLRISMQTIGLLRTLLAGTTPARRKVIANIQFPAMDRIVHSRPAFSFAVSQSSKFIGTYESVNAENLHGWYTGSGMTYLHTADLGHYQNDFWPTADMYRLPGTTIDTRRLNDSQYASVRGSALVGGASVGEDGIACMQFTEFDGDLTGKKAWFMFGDAILCAGADITCTSENPVETIVENRNVGSAQDAFPHVTEGKSWRHIDTVGGYVFAKAAPIKTLSETRSGTWLTINNRPSSPTDIRTRRYITLWLEHGVKPQGATYAYTLLPGATEQATQAWAKRPAIRLISNSAAVQHAGSANEEAAIFWEAGVSSRLKSDSTACILIKTIGNRISVGISDPTEVGIKPIIVEIAVKTKRVEQCHSAISVEIALEKIRLQFDPTGSKGQTRQVVFVI